MTFFYDLNKKLDSIREKPEVTHKQLNERDEGKPGKNFAKIAKDAGERYGSKAAGERVAGAVRNKLKAQGKLEEEGMMDTVKKVGKKVASGVNKLVGHGSDEDMRKDLQRKSGAPVTGKKPAQRGMSEAAGPLDFDKVLDAIAALYGDDIWDNDAMQDLANDLEQAGPTDKELDFIIAKGRLPKRLAGIQFSAGDDVQFGESSAPMTAKQKSFAKLAPPADKITFADKIAGAKKEVDEMLGDVAAEAMRKAVGGGRGRNAEMDEEKSKGTAFDLNAPRQTAPKVGSVERGHKHDIKHTATGRVVTRRTDDQGNSVGANDDTDADAAPRGRGRPKGTKNVSSKAKVFQRKSKLMTKEGEVDIRDQGEYDQEGDMAKDDIKTIVRHAQALSKVLGDDDNLPEWVQSKLAKIEGMMISIDEYMQNQAGDDIDEVAPPGAKAERMVKGIKKSLSKDGKLSGKDKAIAYATTWKAHKQGKVEEESTAEKDDKAERAGKKVAKDIEYDEGHKGKDDNKAERAGKKVKKDIEYDDKKDKEEKVDETTSAGSVATSTATTGSKGGVFGKGIYDSLNRELENMIAESMSINMSDSTEGGKSLTITATDEDALKLGMMLKNAGLGGGDQHGGDMHSHGEEACETCGMQDCGCGDVQEAVDENSPDWPTNTETSPDALQYSGGLNKPKTDVAGDGQTTIPNTAVHTQDEDALRRMMEMAGIKQAELEPWKETMKEEEEDFFHNPNVPADKQLPAPPKEVELDEAEEEVEEDFLESIQRMRAIAGIKEAKKQVDQNNDGKNDFEDIKIARMKASGAIDDKEEKKVDESIFALTNQWKAYKG